jgi:hypothetical protein
MFEVGSCCIAQAGIKFLGLSDSPASTSQVAGIAGTCPSVPGCFLKLVSATSELKCR